MLSVGNKRRTDTALPSSVRPPSPLRNVFIDHDSDSDDDDADSDIKPNSNHSPTSSVSHFAASFAQRVGTFVAATRTTVPNNNHLPTDAELEAEAHRERDRSRREAELILTREAEERRMAEEKILAMKERTASLPPPPSRSQTISDPSSPSGSPKSKDATSWWTAAKNRLTPTKEKDPLTPAQQVILDAKAKEKEKEKSSDLNLNIPQRLPTRPVPTSPASPTPSRNQAPNLTPSPMRSNTDTATSPSREAPPLYAQFTPQGTLDVHGTLLTIVKRFEKLEKWTVGHVRALEGRMDDVERWLVEKEVEKEDKADNKPHHHHHQPSAAAAANVTLELTSMKEELAELQGRVGELGREMTSRMSMSPRQRHSSSSSSPPPPSPPLPLSSSLTGSLFTTTAAPHTPHHPRLSSTTARESTSPPIAAASKHTGTRLPYPTGDYASPPNHLFSPSHSPPESVNSTAAPNTSTNANATATTTASLPSRPLPASPKSTPRVASPTPLSSSHTHHPSSSSLDSLSLPTTLLPPPKIPSPSSSPSGSPGRKTGKTRQSSVSPTPRKRYTVALGEPIVSREPQQVQELVTATTTTTTTKRKHSRNPSLVSTPSSLSEGENGNGVSDDGEGRREEEDEKEDGFQEETIGRSASSRVLVAPDATSSGRDAPPSTSILSRRARVRPQSAYDFSSFLKQTQPSSQPSQQTKHHLLSSQSVRSTIRSQQGSSASSVSSSSSISTTVVAPLSIKSRWRSQSTDRRPPSSSSSGDKGGDAGTKVVEPLSMMRKQERGENQKSEKLLPMPKPMGKIPVGDLVAFFDGEKRG